MSFNVNFNNNQPMIRESQKSQDGGAGNTGYFQTEEEEKRQKQSAAGSIFSEETEQDYFQYENSDVDINFSFKSLLTNFISDIKKVIAKIFNLK